MSSCVYQSQQVEKFGYCELLEDPGSVSRMLGLGARKKALKKFRGQLLLDFFYIDQLCPYA